MTFHIVEDKFFEKIKMRNYVTFIVFPEYEYLFKVQLPDIHSNLDNQCVEEYWS